MPVLAIPLLRQQFTENSNGGNGNGGSRISEQNETGEGSQSMLG